MSGPPARLSVRRLAVAIGGTPVLTDVSLSVEPGQVVALVGASGSGKTMTGLALLDLLPPGGRVTAGEAWLDGRPIDLGIAATPTAIGASPPLPPLERRGLRGRHVAMILQQPRAALHPMRPIGTQLEETVRRHRGGRGRAVRRMAAELLVAAGLADGPARMRAYPHELSGGECQRVMIALALAGEPGVLFADEPTTALDVLVQGRLLEHLRALARRTGMGVVLVTHDLRVVAEVADAAFVIDAGRLVEANACEALFDDPVHPTTRRLLAAAGLAAAGHPPGGSAAAVRHDPPGGGSVSRLPARRPG